MRIVVLLVALLISQQSLASTLKLNYSLFFGYMKTMYKLDYQYVTTAFYLLDPSTGEYCDIEQAVMVVDNKREKINFQPQGRLLPFYSDQHRKDGAMIEVTTESAGNCALQVTPMAKTLQLKALNAEKLSIISAQLEGVLRKNAGMIGKYFLPTYQGLRVTLSEPLTPQTPLTMAYQLADNGDLLISNDALTATQATQLLPYQVVRITPWIIK